MDSKRGTAGLKAFRSLVSNASAEATNNTTTNNNNKNKAGDKEAPDITTTSTTTTTTTAQPPAPSNAKRGSVTLKAFKSFAPEGARSDNSGAEPAATTKRASAALKVLKAALTGPGAASEASSGPGDTAAESGAVPAVNVPPKRSMLALKAFKSVLAGAGGGGGATGGEEEGGSLKSKWGEMKRKQAGTALMGQSLSQLVS